jgi:GNAT superfamily N-acetyltransferase
MNKHQIRALNKEDTTWIIDLCNERWAGPMQITRGRAHHVDKNPGFIAIQDDKPVGVITYNIDGDQCEITLLNSLVEGKGIGSALVNAVKDAAVAAGCRRLWLITTNDNTHALRFWQKRGFKLVAVYPDAIEQSRRIKPEIPIVGNDGIPIRDEIELEIVFG